MNTNIAKTYAQAALFLKKILLRTGDDAASCKKKTSKEGFNYCSLNYKKNKRTKKMMAQQQSLFILIRDGSWLSTNAFQFHFKDTERTKSKTPIGK